jgi:hypothetical protein
MRKRLLTAVAIAAAAFSGVAQASVITETFTGFINSGIDKSGNFGTAGTSLAGDTVTFSFSYDTGLLQADVNAGTDGSANTLSPSNYDKYVDQAGDSAFTESVTINSQTLTFVNSSSNGGSGDLEGCTPTGACGGGPAGLFATAVRLPSNAFIEADLNTTQNYSTGDNLLSQTEVDALVGGWIYSGTIQMSNGVNTEEIELRNVYMAERSATPEPTTWISLALGFGMVGLLKRQRNAR